MKQQRFSRIVTVVVLLLVAYLLPAGPVGAGEDSERPPRALSHYNRVLLNKAWLHNEAEVTVLIAAELGQSDVVAERVTALGGTVQLRVDDIGYLRARVPTEQVGSLAQVAEIVALQLNGNRSYAFGRDTGDPDYFLKYWKHLRPDLPEPPDLPVLSQEELKPDNPYLPTWTIGAPQFIAQHPTFDGRGVTVAIIESWVDFQHPVFQSARQLDGTLTRKIIGVLNTRDLSEDDPSRVRMETVVTARETRLVHDGKTYRVSRDGTYRLGLFLRKGRAYRVLWDEEEGLVWVDTNQNARFTDEKAVSDINDRFDTGTLTKDDPKTEWDDSVSFAVTMDRKNKVVHIYHSERSHGTMTAGLAAGKGYLGTDVHGVAPEAQLLLVYDGGSLQGYIEAFIRSGQHPAVDVISNSGPTSSVPNSGEAFVSEILDRIITVYRKPIFMSAGNSGGSGIVTSSESANTSKVMAVGAYIHRSTLLSNHGKSSVREDWVISYSSRGPSAGGALKPDILAPTSLLSPDSCSVYNPEGWMYRLKGVIAQYKLPPCYRLGGGTSASAPVAAGAAALLVSAAKQSGLPHDAERLRWAMRASARFLPDWAAHEQGAGLVQVGAAWELLQSQVEVPEITVIAPVNHALNRYMKRPGYGVGLYEREGWQAGQSGERTLQFIRTTGPTRPVRYRLSWLGNDGTFQTQASLQFPLGKPVSLPVQIQPREPGIHSAILNLVDPSGGYPVSQLMTTVVLAEPLTPENSFTVRHQGTVEFLEAQSYFVNVPPGTTAIRIALQVTKGKLGLRTNSPVSGMTDVTKAYTQPYLHPYVSNVWRGVGVWSQMFAHPEPGVWEIRVAYGGMTYFEDKSASAPGEFRLAVTALGVETEHSEALLTMDGSSAGEVLFTNQLGPILGSVMVSELGSAFRTRSTVEATGKPPIYEIHVEPGTRTLLVQIEEQGNRRSDLDLYLYDCTSGYCYLWDIAMADGAKESIIVRGPKPGLWKTLVSPAILSADQTTFSYLEVMTNPVYGSVTTETKTMARAPRENWTQEMSIRRAAAPVAPREPVMLLVLIDREAENQEQQHPFPKLDVIKDEPRDRPPNRPIGLINAVYFLTQREQVRK